MRFVEYVHIKANSSRVQVGDTVKKGDILCLSGDVGLCPQPHLHLQIVNSPGKHASTVPFHLHGIEDEGTGSHHAGEKKMMDEQRRNGRGEDQKKEEDDVGRMVGGKNDPPPPPVHAPSEDEAGKLKDIAFVPQAGNYYGGDGELWEAGDAEATLFVGMVTTEVINSVLQQNDGDDDDDDGKMPGWIGRFIAQLHGTEGNRRLYVEQTALLREAAEALSGMTLSENEEERRKGQDATSSPATGAIGEQDEETNKKKKARKRKKKKKKKGNKQK